MFIKAGDSETKEGLRVEEAVGERRGGALLWLPRVTVGRQWTMLGCVDSLRSKSHSVRSDPCWGCCLLTKKSQERGPWRWVRWVSLGRAAAAHCSPSCKSHGGPLSLGEKSENAHLRGKKSMGCALGRTCNKAFLFYCCTNLLCMKQ